MDPLFLNINMRVYFFEMIYEEEKGHKSFGENL